MRNYLFFVLSMMIIGSLVPVSKWLTESFPVFIISFGRLGLAAVCFTLVFHRSVTRWRDISKRDRRVILLQSFVGVFLFSVFFLFGVKQTSAIESGMLLSLTPAFIALIGVIALREPLSRWQWLSIALSIVGVMLVKNHFGAIPLANMIGSLLILGAVACEALYMVASKFTSAALNTASLSVWSSAISALLFSPFALYESMTMQWSAVPLSGWLSLLYAGVIVTFGAVYLLNWSVPHLRNDVTALLAVFMPIGSVLFSLVLLGESLSLVQWSGILVCLVSIVIGTRRSA